jgi:hypothetical protein
VEGAGDLALALQLAHVAQIDEDHVGAPVAGPGLLEPDGGDP